MVLELKPLICKNAKEIITLTATKSCGTTLTKLQQYSESVQSPQAVEIMQVKYRETS